MRGLHPNDCEALIDMILKFLGDCFVVGILVMLFSMALLLVVMLFRHVIKTWRDDGFFGDRFD